MHREYKLSSYSLNSVSAQFLGKQDAYLPQRLLDKLMFMYTYVEMARVTGVPISYLLSRGESIKVLSQLVRKAKQKNLIIPNVKRAGSEQGTYEGATVKSEDFGTLVIPPESVIKTPLGDKFVQSELQKGILPEIPEELITAWKRARADFKEAKDPSAKAVLDWRQLAFKISANFICGFTGDTVGQLPCLEISSSVTSYGRQAYEKNRGGKIHCRWRL